MFLVFVFVFCVAFVSVLFALFLFCCWIVFGVGSCFALVLVFLFFMLFVSCVFLFSLFFFCFFLFVLAFCFLGGFKGQVRWPKGPPHLALNPPYFLFVFMFLCFFCFAFCFFIEKSCFPHLDHNLSRMAVLNQASGANMCSKRSLEIKHVGPVLEAFQALVCTKSLDIKACGTLACTKSLEIRAECTKTLEFTAF